MPAVTILTEGELRACVALDPDVVDIVERAFAALGQGGVVMPPILSMAIEDHHGEVDVKTAYVPGVDSFAIKVSPGFFDNPKLGLPSLNGLMIVLSAHTGLLKAVLLDNGYLTDIRTAAAGAVAARHLAPTGATTAGILGTGLQARLQARALTLVRPIDRILVWGRDAAKAERCAADLAGALAIEARALDDPERVVAESAIVVTTTPAREPVLRVEWLHAGLHVTAMGSDADYKNEIDPAALGRADLFVCDRRAQSATVGELRSAIAAGVMAADQPVTELGQVIVGARAGRAEDAMITICDLTGTGVQDTAIATHAAAVAAGRGFGKVIDSDARAG